MTQDLCYVCGKKDLSKDEIGLTKKLLGHDKNFIYCIDCLAEYLEVETDYLQEKVNEFKDQGCKFF